MLRVVSFFGFICFCFLAWLLSSARRKIRWRPLIAAAAAEFLLAAAVFHCPGSRRLFLSFSRAFIRALEASREGITFVFGDLGKPGGPFILAFQSLPFIVIFSALTGLLYHLRVLPWIIGLIARRIKRALGISAAESLCAASNIFVGIESVTTIRPYLGGLTRSELFLILTVGMATVASSVMALYVSLLGGVFPTIAGHLFSASVLSVPASVLAAKLMEPETGTPETAEWGRCRIELPPSYQSFIGSVISGAADGGRLVAGIVVSLLAFIGLLGILRAGISFCSGGAVTAEQALGFVFYPFAFLLGLAPEAVPRAAELLGMRLVFTEVPAYIRLAELLRGGLDSRSAVIISYALCGFSHVASLGIFAGGISALVPERRGVIASIGVRALIASTLATLLTGAVAGVFCSGGVLL